MGIGRSFFLRASRSRKLREMLPRYGFIRRSVARFMPGESVGDALNAAKTLGSQGIPAVVTHLGENVTEERETRDVTDHYLNVLDQIQDSSLDTHISVKLTELGLDLNQNLCYTNLQLLLQKAKALGNSVWIDMEGSNYTDATLQLYQRALSEFQNTGLCLQSYLYRTADDLAKLLPLSPTIRLVKGAYAEPPQIAFPKKRDNDENYFELARKLLQHSSSGSTRAAFATHDGKLIHRIAHEAETLGIGKDAYEIQMLFGIRSRDQLRLAKEGFCVRVLISYGSYWFPWYMRRLAERPANVLFVLRNLLQ